MRPTGAGCWGATTPPGTPRCGCSASRCQATGTRSSPTSSRRLHGSVERDYPCANDRMGESMFETTIAGSLPKPSWLAEPNVLWAPWKQSGDDLATAKRDATMLAIKQQEDAGIEIVTEGEKS